MGKRSPNYIIVIALLVVTATISYWVRYKPVEALHTPDLTAFPRTIGPWTGEDQAMTEDVAEGIEADEYLWRVYLDDDDLNYLGLLVVYRKYGRRGFVHRPEMCYPAAGWELPTKRYVTLPYNGDQVKARLVNATRADEKELVLYWFVSGDRIEGSYVKQQYLMALDRMQTNKYGWAFVRINVPVIYSEEDALEHVRKFLGMASGPLQDALLQSASRHSRAPEPH